MPNDAPMALDDRRILLGGPGILTGSGVVTERAEGPDQADETVTVELPSGREISISSESDGEDRIHVRAADGAVELHVRFTADGPVLRFEGADLELASPGAVTVECDEYRVAARRAIVHETGGELTQRVGGDANLEVGGDLRARARSVEARAMRGDVRLRANDDVRVRGERIRLNC